ncbi:MAG: enoyl-CoA hydratase-related protein [Burkholderiaceae bacterium]|nr:enoyl-CoA hydratase-related protein [Burkholderiaceae bacterium]
MNETILQSIDRRGVVTLTLNRPEINNAYDDALIDAVLGAIDQLAGIDTARALVVQANGRHFQAGADLGWLARVAGESAAANVRASRRTAEVVHRLNTLPLPTLALVQGACFGGGTGIIAACDIVVAASNAIFAIAESRWGLIANIIVPQLADAIGVRQLRRYALTGERFDAAEALRIGLVHEVVPPATLAGTGERIVDQLLQNAPEATAQTKAAILEQAHGDLSAQSFARLVAQHAARRQSDEAAEGFASFREKRAARWYPGKPEIET